MKKLLLFLFLIFPLSIKADSTSVGGQFRGLNNGDSSILIQDNEAQDLLNVDLTKNAYGVVKRGGTAQFKTIGVSSVGVRGGYYFTDQSGNNKIIHANNASVYYSVNGGAYTAFYTTATGLSYWDFTDSQGILYGANNNHDPPFTYNGTTLSFSTSMPHGSQVEIASDRLVVAGSTANPNTINFSRSADFQDFSIGRTENEAPYSEYYGLPGQLIQAIKYSLGEILIWTKTSMGRYVGTNQFDGAIDDISSTIGTDQPSTVVTDLGITYFQGTDRHFYSYDGQGLAKISQAISGSVSDFVKNNTRSWLNTTQSDFGTGNFGVSLSSTISIGDIAFSTTAIDDFADGDYTSSPIWTPVGVSKATWSVVGSELLLTPTGSPGTPSGGLYVNNPVSTGTWQFIIHTTNTVGAAAYEFLLCNTVPTTFVPQVGCYAYELSISATSPSASDGVRIYTDSTHTGFTTWTHSSNLRDGNNHKISISRNSNGYTEFSIDGVVAISSTTTKYTTLPYLLVGSGGGSSTGFPWYFDDFKVAYNTGAYVQQSFNIGTTITQWGSFHANKTLTGSGDSIAFSLYTDTDSSIDTNNPVSFTSSQTITDGTIPSLATAAYVTWRADFSRFISTENPTLNDVTLNWYETLNPFANQGSVDKDHRILWSVVEGTSTVPNSTYIYDPRFDSWLKYSVPLNAPTRVGDTIYFGGVSTGVVYQWPSGNTDNGSAINAYWKSKDFIAPDPYVEKDFVSTSIVAKTQTGSNLDVTYTINTSSAITKNFSLTDSGGLSLKRINFKLPSGKFGSFINFKFGNDDADAPFEFYTFRYDYKPRPWRTLQ